MRNYLFSLLMAIALIVNCQQAEAQLGTLLNQNFNNTTAGVPANWNNSDYDCSSSYIWQSDANGYNGTRCMKFNTYSAYPSGSYSTLKTPVLNLNAPYVLRFKYRNYNAGQLDVRISFDGGSSYSTVIAAGLTTSDASTWSEVEYSLTPYQGQSNVRIVFYGVSNYGSSYQYIDDVVIESAPLCKSPYGVYASNLTTTSALINWGLSAEGDVPGSFQIKVTDENGTVIVNDNNVSGTSFSYPLTGLSANTTYTVTMRGDCSSTLSGQSKYTSYVFTTACNPAAFPYIENFDALTGIPDCTTSLNASIDSSIKNGSSGKSLKLTTSATDNAYMIFPILNHAANDIEMSFFARCSSTAPIVYMVGIVSDPADIEGTFEPLRIDSLKNGTTWEEVRMNTSLASVSTAPVMMCIFLGSGNAYSMYVDDVDIHAIPSCVRPEQFRAYNATHNSVDLTWSTSTANTHLVEIIDASSTTTQQIATTNPYTVTGLQPNSQYSFRLRAICSPTDTSAYASSTVTAKTLCAPMTTTIWSEGAESTSGTDLPDCWTYGFFNRTGSSTYDQPFVSQTSTTHSGSRSFALRDMSSGNISYMSSNGFPVDSANKYQASIWVYRPSGTSYVGEGLRLFASNSPDDVTNAQELGFINRYAGNAPVETGSGWFNYTYPIGLTGTVYLIIQGESKYGSATNFDDISVGLAPTCFPSGDISMSAPSMSDVTLSWSAGVGNETSWIIAYDLKVGSIVVATDSQVVTQPTYTITGLSPATSYTVNARVYAMCTPTDIANAKSFSGSFTTPCATVTTFPYYEDFESQTTGQTPNCWDNSASTTSSKSTAGRVWGVYEYSSNKMIRMYNYLVQSGTALVNTPTIQLPAQPAAELQFDYSNRANCGDIYVKISTDGGSTFADLSSYSTTSSSNSTDPGTFTTANIDLAAYAGQDVIIQFYSVANYGNGSMFIDNVLFRLQPNCRDLPQPTVVNILPNSATVMIADTASMWDISYGPQGTAAGAGTIVNVNDTNAYTITGLTVNTTYDVYVRRNCGTEVGAWTLIPVSFTAECADLYATYSDIDARSFKVTTDALDWDLCYGPLGTQPGAGTVQSVTGSLDYTVTGLTPSTSYVFYVRRVCGYEFSDWSYSYTVTTTSVPDSIPFATGFEDDNDNAAWTIVNGTNATNHFIFGTAAAAVASGSKALYITNGTSAYAYTTSSATKTYAYRTIYFGSGVHNVSFQWKCTGGESSYDFGRVMLVPASETITGGTGSGYSSTTFPNFVEAFDPEGKNYMNLTTGDADGWNTYTADIDMTGREGTYNFVVMWNDDSSVGTSQYPISIDNIRISQITCVKPTVMPSATSSTGTTINVVTQTAPEWEIVVSTTPIDVFGTVTGDIYQQISSAPAVITGLTANTAYYYTARIICAPGDTSVWADPQTVRTSCAACNVPFSEGFEDSGALACWPSFGNVMPSRSTTYKYSGSASCNITDGTAVSPELNVTTLASYMLTGWCYSTSDSVQFTVGVMTDPEDAGSFQDLGTVTIPTASTWTEFTTYFTLLTDPDYSFVYNARHFAISAGADAVIYVDDLYLGPTPTCPKPTEVAITNVLANSFNMAWTENGTATSWRIKAVPATIGQATIDTVVSTNPTVISGLNASSSYSISITSICSAADSSIVTNCGSVTTACDIVAAPYSENFETMTAGTIPNCWDNSASTCSASSPDYKWGVYEEAGNKMIRMHNYWCNDNGSCVIETPIINLTGVNGFEFKFDYCHQASCDPFTAEISTNGGTSWSVLGTYSSNSSGSYTTPGTWTTATINLYAYTGSNVKLRFNSTPDYGSGAIFIDNIRVLALRSCSDPQSVYVGASENTASVVITDPVPTHSQWQYIYGTTGFDPSTATPQMTNTTNFTITGLTPSTAYDIYVRTYCDSVEQSNWVQYSFSTTATPATLPYICHFDDATENAEWNFSTNSTSTVNHFTIGTDANARQSGENGALYVTNGSSYTYTTSSAASSAAAYRLFYFTPSQFTVSFSWKCTGGEGSYDYARFYLVPARDPVYLPSTGYYQTSGWPTDMIALDGGTKVNLTSSPVWNDVEATIDMSGRPGSYYLVFIWSNDNSAGTANYPLAVNNIQISEVSCPGPGNINVPAATITQTSAVVNFTDNTAGAATIRYWINTTGNRTDVLQSGTATASPFTINGLSPSTTYYLYMQAECSASDMSPVTSTTFSTACGIVNAFPFTEGFESTQFAPNCWTSTASTSGMTWARYTTTASSSSYIHSGSASAYLSNNSYDGESCLLATPTITFDGTRDYHMSFYMYRTTSSYYSDVVNVYLSDSPTDISAATLLSSTTVGGASSSGSQEVAFDLPTGTSGDKYIVFEGQYNYYGYVYIDDITIDVYATCRALSGAPTVDATTATTMTVSAVKDANHIGVLFAYAPASAVSVADTIGSVFSTTGSAVITGLTAGTTYKVFACGICAGNDTSMWTSSTSGTTMTSDCFEPQNLRLVGLVGATSATLTWGGSPLATGYEWKLGASGTSTTTQSDTVVLQSLTPKTSYTFYVRALCSDGETSWVTLSFTTIAVPAVLPYVCDFEDTQEANQWEVLGTSQTNYFTVGTATSNGGGYSLYVTNDGTSNTYTNTSASVSFVSRFFQFPTGQYTYSYDWNCNGESTYDYGRAYIAPSNATFTPGTLPSGVGSTGTPSGWIALDNDAKLNQVSSWQNVAGSFTITNAANYMLVFIWRNDGSVGTNPPIAFDNVRITKLVDAPMVHDTICYGEPYVAHGFNIDAADLVVGLNPLQRVKAGSPGTSDTVIYVNLYMRPQIQAVTYDTLCQGSPLVWGGIAIQNPTSRPYLQSGFTSVTGCDSSAILYLTVVSSFHEFFDTICSGTSYQFGSQTLTQSGDYYNFTPSRYGSCLDTTLLHLNVIPTNDTLRESICKGQSFSWHGTQYTTSGVYRWTGTTTRGCSLNEVLYLNVLDGDSTANINICQGGSYLFKDTTITTAGTYVRSFYDVTIGCNINITLNVTVSANAPTHTYDIACQGHPYTGYGVFNLTVTHDTTIVINTRTIDAQCDSVSNVHLTFKATTYSDNYASIVQGDVYHWNGEDFTNAGDYTRTYPSVDACDSVVTLHLTYKGSGVDNVSDVNMTIVPNPVNAGATALVYGEFGEVENVEILNNFGQVIDRFIPQSYPIEVSGISASGLYYVRVTTKSGNVHLQKLIVK